jgi:hypothetical protein
VPPQENPFPADADSLTSFAAEPREGKIVGPSGREADERGSIRGRSFAKRSYLVSAKRRRVRRMSENCASKSALGREGSLLDDSDPAKGGTAWAIPFIMSDRGRGGRAVAPPIAENSSRGERYFPPADSAALAPFHRASPVTTDLLVKEAK